MHPIIVVFMKQGGQRRPGETWLDWPSSDSRGRRQQERRRLREKVCAVNFVVSLPSRGNFFYLVICFCCSKRDTSSKRKEEMIVF